MEDTPRHQCLIYDGSPARLLPVLTAVISAKLKESWRCVYINSPAMVAGIRSYLAASGTDVAGEIGKGSLVLSSDQGHLVEGRFDKTTMIAMLVETIHKARKDGYANLWVSGDMTWELGNDRDFPELVEYEHELERLFLKHRSLHGICQYHRDTLPAGAIDAAVCGHRSLFLNETLSRLNPWFAPSETPAQRRLKPSAAQLAKLISPSCDAAQGSSS